MARFENVVFERRQQNSLIDRCNNVFGVKVSINESCSFTCSRRQSDCKIVLYRDETCLREWAAVTVVEDQWIFV